MADCNCNKDIHNHPVKEHPADLLKFISWNKLADSYEDAVKKILDKKPILGEPIVVPFKFWKSDIHNDYPYDASVNPNGYTQELVFGIGSMDPNHPYIHCSISHDVLNYAVIAGTDDEGNPKYTTLGELLDQFVTKDGLDAIVQQYVSDAMGGEEVINTVAEKVAEKNAEYIVNAINEKLTWKPLSGLIE